MADEKNQNQRVRLRNSSAGPRGVNAIAGTRVLQPGEEGDFEMSMQELSNLSDFSITYLNKDGTPVSGKLPGGGTQRAQQIGAQGDGEDGGDEYDGMTDDELRSFLEERDGRAPPSNIKRETMLRRARGDDDGE